MGTDTVRLIVQEVEPGVFGARPARTDVDAHADPYYPYVHRSVDDDLAEALDRRADGSDRRPLVLAGQAMSGASRMIAQALRTHPVLSAWTLIVPPGDADPAAVIEGAPADGAVVWLDHVDDSSVGWDSRTLEAWSRHGRLLVAASVRTELLEGVLDDRDFHSPWSVLADPQSVEMLRLPGWTVRDLPPTGVDPLITHRVALGQSLGQALGAADELLARVKDSGPVAGAVARVVADWARMGLHDGVPEQVAEQLWLSCLSRRQQQTLADDTAHERRDRFEAAVGVLTEPIPATTARPVTRTVSDRLLPDGFLVAHPPHGWAIIGRHVWSAGLVQAMASGDPRTLLAFGLRAYVAEAHDIARGAWDAVARMDTPLSCWGWALLGELHGAQDEDPTEAIAALWTAVRSGHPDAGPAAGSALGRLLEVREPAAAREAYESVLHSGHAALAPEAALRLGWLLEWDDPAAARTAYETAIRSAHPGIAPEAAVYLAWMLESEDPAAARAAYQVAIASGHQDWAPKAAADLGWMLSESDPAAAREWYEVAIASGHQEWTPRAAVRLGQLLATTDPPGAAAAYEVAVASRHGEWSPMAAVRLGRLLAVTEPMAACAALRVAISSKHNEYAPIAELLYGEWCVGSDATARWRHWSRAASSGNARVLVDLACLCVAEGALDQAHRSLVSAAKAGSSFAEDYLDILAADAADLRSHESFARIRSAAEAGDTASMNILGLLAMGWGDIGEARNWWLRSAGEQDTIAPLLLHRHM